MIMRIVDHSNANNNDDNNNDNTKNRVTAVPGFQTGSGQTGLSQKGHKFLTCCHMLCLSAHMLPQFAQMLQRATFCAHLTPIRS